jgi:iron complex transport system substrate-binding protein
MRTLRTGFIAVLVLLGLVYLPVASGASGAKKLSTSAGSHFPVTLHAANGVVTVKSRPTAIVSLSPTATEMLYAIGAGHQVKAVDSYSTYPPGAPVTKLNGYNPNVEAIAKYRPDLVIVSTDSADFNRQMAHLKIPVIYDPAAANLRQAYQQYLTLGAATGNVHGAKVEVASVKAKIAHIVATTPRVPKGTTYYYELDPTYYSVTSSTFMGQLLSLIGLKSIANSVTGAAVNGGYPQLSAEFILRANPTYIILADTICCHATAKSVAQRPGWSALSAVRHKRIIPLNDSIASEWGPRITLLLKDVAHAIARSKVHATS